MTDITRSNVAAIANAKRFLPTINKKSLIITFCCFYAVVFLSSIGSTEKSTSSLRATLLDEGTAESSENIEIESRKVQKEKSDGDKDKEQVDEKKVQQQFRNAMKDIKDSMKDEFTVTMGWLHNAVTGAKTSVHRSIDEILRSTKNVSDKDVEDFDEEVSKKVEEQLQSELMTLIDEAFGKVKEELDSIQKSEIGDKNKSAKDIELDVESIRPFFVDRMEGEIDDLEKKLENKLHTITTKVEKELLEEKFGVEKTEVELEDAEVEAVLGEIEDEVIEVANDEASSMQEEIENAEIKLEAGIKTELNQFLVKEKKFSKPEAEEIQNKILSSLDNELTSLINNEIASLETIANERIDLIQETAASDLNVIDKAKELGMTESIQEGSTNAVDIVEPRLDSLKKELEESFKGIIAASKDQLIHALSTVTKGVEEKTFKEKGIHISEEELAALVEKETKDIEKPSSFLK